MLCCDTIRRGAGGGEGVLVLRAPSVLKILGAPSPKGKKYQKMNFHFQCLILTTMVKLKFVITK